MSRFVSAGAEENPAEQDEEWQKAYAAIEATRQKKNTPAMGGGSQEGGKSLYETLQANKAAKQEAFEESLKLSNQFQSLNEDEVEFLDSVMESTRAQEAAVKKETTEQLDAFRRQQEEAERAAKQAGSPEAPETAEQESWSVGKKRKKGKESLFGAVKLRRSSTTDKSEQATAKPTQTTESTKAAERAPSQDAVKTETAENSSANASPGVAADSKAAAKPAPTGVGLGLGAYSSDEDD
ncbi:PSME3-interacting protein, partial [Pseudocercospora fuligena]